MTFITANVLPAAPEIFVFSMACMILIVDLFLTEPRRVVSYLLTQLTLAGAAVLTVQGLAAPGYAFNGMFVADVLAGVLKLAIYLVTFFVFAYSRDYLRDRGMFRGEYFVLGLFGVVGMMAMVSASHFLTLYLGLELLSLSLYAMVAFQRDSDQATEAAMKYFVLGAIASGMLLYGMSMLYGVTRSLDIATVRQAVSALPPDHTLLVFGLVFVVVGIAFKLGAVPFHMWVPDVYHGAPTAVTLYLGTAPKLAAFALVMRLLIGGVEHLSASWQDMLVILAVLSMGIGNIVAIAQDNLKRMLAYSSISHTGFFLLGILSASPNGYSSALFYVLVYAVMSLGSFGMIVLLSRAGFEAERLADFKGLNQRSPWYAFLMMLLMFSMAGVPPTVGFYAKLLVIQSVVNAGLVWLAVAAVLLAVIGAYYYLRVVKLMYFDDAEDRSPIAARGDVKVLLGANALSLLVSMPWIGALIDLCRQAIQGIR
ncbi:MAG: NADH-quinone oxidoreductase subunit N [Candidatus Muproteobacteria bacterium RBG_16_65_34]|uniref:NADH-quinone oxidoreductase subunit N n=1 Tax=Candidatus Muproteobacteria bacterium RBG_16_65_34 TaxID=1817760 RepID=A0A1F6TKX4_9PROT|nr:MAG: NADH-quinone oxidoreductase subunit N [Candidatus Muproteobacteria bacterium RBG_16_65_34]